jgi:hypothetical protein
MAAVRSREVTFTGAGGVRLAGTLTLPPAVAGKNVRFPALVLIAGSGPTDRDGNQGEALRTDLLRQAAELLAGIGVAALRYDKRGISASQKLPPAGSDWAAFAAWENFVGDAEAALACVRLQPEIDAARAGLFGHSEGGLMALHAADRARGSAKAGLPAALVLASTPGRPTDVIVREQLTRILALQKATLEQTKFFLDRNDAIVAAVRATGKVPPDVPPGLAALYPPYLGPFYKSLLALRPTDLAARYTGPVLLLQGAEDVQVSAERDARALDAALAKRRPDRHEMLIAPGVSHNLKPVKGTEDPGFTGPLAPAVAARLRAWAAATLVSPQAGR